MAFTNTMAAAYGLLAMHATDMFRVGGSLTPPPAPGLTAAGWTIRAYITGNDTLLDKGPLQLKGAIVFYGYLAERAPGELAAVIRGTDGFVEWVEDGEFSPILYAPQIPLPATQDSISVEQGFWTLYASMQLISPTGAALGALAPAITNAAVSTGTVTVVGHSLGAALATYLTLDLARGSLGPRVSACLFASPHTGNQGFVTLFDQTIADYRLFNYILDLVPRVPLGLGYMTLPRRTVLQPATAEANIRVSIGCNHHVICYCAMLDYEGTLQATTPVPAGEEDSAACILGPETGKPSLAKELVSDLAGVVPV
jgi:triacylglycerol lipase